VKLNLGLDQCKFGFTGAAPIQTQTLEYFGSLGIQINEVYGMSECCGATTWSTDARHLWGSCGWTFPGSEVRVFTVNPADVNDKQECPAAKDIFDPDEKEQGELCYRGRHVMLGYMANPELGQEHVDDMKKKTAEAIDAEGWLHSGDKGCVGENGMFRITGRYKELIIGAGGENVAPVPIEDQFKRLAPGVSNIMMVGDKRKFNVALVTLKAKGATGDLPGGDELDGAALDVSPGITTISAAVKDPVWAKYVTDKIKEVNKSAPNQACFIQKFTILPRDFSVNTEELTPTLKVKRSFVEKMHVRMLDQMYESELDYVPYDVALLPASFAVEEEKKE
jgi:long-chain-fatty-acid--CoA ligase ACSBG